MITKLNTDLAFRKSEWILQTIDSLPLLFSPLLIQFPVLTHAFTTRLGGNSEPPRDSFNLGASNLSEEQRQDAFANRKKLCAALSLPFDRLVIPGQIHSATVVLADSSTKTTDNPATEADAVVANNYGQPLLLHFADCVPIIIVDPIKEACAVVHAGWRGTAGKIVSATVKFLTKECGSDIKDLAAAVGPAICSSCFQTGQDVAYKLLTSVTNEPMGDFKSPDNKDLLDPSLLFKIQQAELDKFFPIKENGIYPDLKAINALQLAQVGVEKIDVTNLCTACNPDLFYSHRQSGGKTGRQGAVASLVS